MRERDVDADVGRPVLEAARDEFADDAVEESPLKRAEGALGEAVRPVVAGGDVEDLVLDGAVLERDAVEDSDLLDTVRLRPREERVRVGARGRDGDEELADEDAEIGVRERVEAWWRGVPS